MKKKRKLKNSVKLIVAIVLIVVFIIGIIAIVNKCEFNDAEYTVTVTDKERIEKFIKSGNDVTDQSYYLIFCKDNEGNYYEFKNEDSLVRGKFDSSTFYNKIEIGKTYRFTVVGYRMPFFSTYQNIIAMEEVG